MLDFPSAGMSERAELVIAVKTGILSLQDWLDLGEELMNQFLASALGYLNVVVDFLIFLTCVGTSILLAIASGVADVFGPEFFFTVIGAGGTIGVIIAVMVCGFIALLVDIRNTVRNILVELRYT